MKLVDLKRLTEDEARALVEAVIWPDGPVCTKCGNCDQARIVKITANKEKRIREGLRRCKECRTTFTVTKGTILEGSHFPMRVWVHIIAAMCNGKKGVAARQLWRELKEYHPESGSYGNFRNLWHACHRVRHAMAEEGVAELLGGAGRVVEMDETLLGGSPRYRAKGTKPHPHRDKKTIVVTLVERGGKSRSAVVRDTNAMTLRGHLVKYADTKSRLMTDEHKSYAWPGKLFAEHGTTRHYRREYARGDVHSNTAESWFSIAKMSYRAIHNGYSDEHTFRYLAERDFTWSTKTMSEVDRVRLAISKIAGKRLFYKAPKNRGLIEGSGNLVSDSGPNA